MSIGTRKPKQLFIGLSILYGICLCIGILVTSMPFEPEKETEKPPLVLDHGWRIIADGVVQGENESLPYTVSDKEFKVIELFHRLPNHLEGRELIATTVYQKELSMYLDGKLLYESTFHSDRSNQTTPGSGDVFVALPSGSEGKMLQLRYTKVVEGDTSSIRIVEIQNGQRNPVREIPGDNKLFFITVAMFLIGSVLLLISTFYFCSGVHSTALIQLALFIMSASMWILCNSNALQFFTGNLVLMHNLEYISFYFIPITAWAFLWLSWKEAPKAVPAMLCCMTAFFLVALTFKFFGIRDFYYLLEFFHFLFFINIIIFCLTGYKAFQIGTTSLKLFYLGFAALAVCSLVNLFQFYFVNVSKPMADWYVVGTILMGILVLLSFVSGSKEKMIQNIENDMYRTLAFTDGLTKIGNRASCEETITAVSNNLEHYRDVVISVLDLNGLKSVNDTFGHLDGDEMIKCTAAELAALFQDFGTCARIGGDEFCVISLDREIEAVEERLNRLNEVLAAASDQYPISVSHGSARYDKNVHFNLQEVFREADDNMYKNKREFKKNTENR